MLRNTNVICNACMCLHNHELSETAAAKGLAIEARCMFGWGRTFLSTLKARHKPLWIVFPIHCYFFRAAHNISTSVP